MKGERKVWEHRENVQASAYLLNLKHSAEVYIHFLDERVQDIAAANAENSTN